MSQPLSELCTLLVDDLYGELCSRVFAILIHYGRLSLQGLLKYSSLTVRHLKHGLAVLIQQHLILHYTPEDDDITFYEANWQHAYGLVRSGKIVQIIEDRYGEASGGIATNLLLLGHVRVKDMAEAYGVQKKKRNTANGHTPAFAEEDLIQTNAQLHSKIRELEQGGYIIRVDEKHFTPPEDLHNEAERIVRSDWLKEHPKDSKKDNDRKIKVNDLKRKWRDGEGRAQKKSGKLNLQNLESLLNDGDAPARKKRRVNGNRAIAAMSDSDDEQADAPSLFDDETAFRINIEKCEVAMRNQRLVEFATRYIGSATAKVYEALLRCLEDNVMRCRDELSLAVSQDDEMERAPYVNTGAIMNALAKEKMDLSLGKPKKREAERANGVNGHHRSHDGEGSEAAREAEREAEQNLTDEQRRAQSIEQQLELLAADPRHFITNVGRGKWKVNYRSLTQQLLSHDIETTIKDKFGDYAAMAMRIMKDKGKLDEKQISTYALLRTRELRSTLGQMQGAGYVENQEIPKDNSRQPSRTLYLWFFDEDRCRQLILTDVYKSMSRILQRIKSEKSVVQPVIDKAERSDVVGHEDDLLTIIEKNALRSWMETEEQLLAQLSRQDDLVAVLRDYQMPYLRPTDEDA
ncbi:hypothetical protein EJ05DRAFT_503077 [Pseudovirgaria hyperparasitica]|uniref:DNA-directed RNA polymerase III subunit RPC3 n=1 Tax=Pseudovirgaria hyperparasitica TaxID=470096 RepID=A0A6A6VZF4_9PEZI|nr:uncharacterized protein EJ05DRAFT_503077 [Pseudovirgaria hyperparasitica]KAF2755615.1 hypothetical protein EJ05DRAFT_503077 [Pseudovirgaria hyperparasitica]